MAASRPIPPETRDTAAARALRGLDRYLSLIKPLSIGLAAVLLTLLVGVSRVALGVHWATDVLGGWAFGAARA